MNDSRLMVFCPRASVGPAGICTALGRVGDANASDMVLLHGPADVPIVWPGIRRELPLGRSLAGQASAAMNPLNILRVLRFVREHRVKNVYVVSSHPIDVLLALVAPLMGLTICFHLHDPAPHSSQRGAAAVRLFNKIMAAMRWIRLSVSSPEMLELVVALKLRHPTENVSVIPLPSAVDTAAVTPRRNRDLMLMIGRVEHYKGPDLFVDIAKQCGSDLRDFKFVIAGPDEQGVMGTLGERCRAAGVHVESGVLPDAKFAEYLSRAVAVCMPYRDATNSGVAPAAFACGTPVVAFAVGGLAATVRPEVNGILCPPGDIAAFASALKRVASNSDLFDNLSSGARESAREHSPAHVLGAIVRSLTGPNPR